MSALPTFYEFFAGGGMARAGLGPHWQCVFANDFNPMKASTYASNWGADHLVCGDVAALHVGDLPGRADLAWASFPCQDLSLAGDYLGLGHAGSAAMTRSGTFWPFWNLMKALKRVRRAPRLIVLENVYGALTSHDGKDFAAICAALSGAGYRFGAFVMDAADFVPQSRQRVFFVAVAQDVRLPEQAVAQGPSLKWHPRTLVDAMRHLSPTAKARWVWWDLPKPKARQESFADLIESDPVGVRWHSLVETDRILGMMSPLHQAKVAAVQRKGRLAVGGVYRRTRPDGLGGKCQRAEVRFDDVAGCLRTPRGGSSRQMILLVDGPTIRSRLLSPREAARLMGLPDDYKLPSNYNDAYHVAGDGVCAPAVRHIAQYILEPAIAALPEIALIAAE